MKKKGWEHYSHTADMGIRGFGETKQEAFEQTAIAMIAVSVELDKIRQTETVEIACEGNDDETLLFVWLNKILYEMATRKMLFSKFEVRIDGNKLAGKAYGEKMDLKRHKPVVEIKGATYCDLKVQQDKNGTWVAQCIVDI
jgi:SHS2 domain-containing protein